MNSTCLKPILRAKVYIIEENGQKYRIWCCPICKRVCKLFAHSFINLYLIFIVDV